MVYKASIVTGAGNMGQWNCWSQHGNFSFSLFCKNLTALLKYPWNNDEHKFVTTCKLGGPNLWYVSTLW